MNAMTRLEHFNALARTGAPDSPFSTLLGIRLESVEPGKVSALLDMRGSKMNNPLGFLHGGVVASLSDHVMGLALLSMLPEDEIFTTIELKVNYLRGVKKDCTLRAVGKVLKAGRTIAVVESDVFDDAGELVGRVVSTCIRLPAPRA
ncbi:MAG: PaaI family thioesterase [Archangium sp.]